MPRPRRGAPMTDNPKEAVAADAFVYGLPKPPPDLFGAELDAWLLAHGYAPGQLPLRLGGQLDLFGRIAFPTAWDGPKVIAPEQPTGEPGVLP